MGSSVADKLEGILPQTLRPLSIFFLGLQKKFDNGFFLLLLLT